MLIIFNESDNENSGKEKKDYKSNEGDFFTRVGCELEDFGERHIGAREQNEEKQGKHGFMDWRTMAIYIRSAHSVVGSTPASAVYLATIHALVLNMETVLLNNCHNSN